MKPYQEKLLQLAGFTPPHKHDRGETFVWSKTVGNKDIYAIDGRDFDSLDWLEEYIMPSVRRQYDTVDERYFYDLIRATDYLWLCQLVTDEGILGGIGDGQTKVEALNNALEELVK